MLDLLFFEFHRAACEVKYYLKEFYVEAEFAFAAVAEKAIFAFAAIADKAVSALAAVADEAIFALAAVADEAIFAFAAVTDKAIVAAFASFDCFGFFAIFAVTAIALGVNWSLTAGSVYNDVVFFFAAVILVCTGLPCLSGSRFGYALLCSAAARLARRCFT